jgi:ABC-type glycerol-3-phosphate transport system substrate-binding protein
VFRDFAEKGDLLPLDNLVGDTLDQQFEPVWRELGTVDGKLYGVWFKSANKSTFWYNIHVFDDAGVQPPKTWEELQDVANTISQFGLPPYAIDGGSAWPLSDWFENIYIRTAGVEKYDQLATHEISWTDPSVKEALGVFGEVVGNDSNLLGGVSGTLQSEFPAALVQTFSKDPQAGLYYEADFVATAAGDEAGAKPGVDLDYFDFPSIDGSGPVVVSGGDVAVMLRDTPAARAVIQFLASPEAGEIWAGLGGFTSPNKNVDPSVYPDAIARRAAETLVSAEDVRYDLSDQQPGEFGATEGQGIWGLLQEFVRNPGNVDGITQQLEAAAKQAYGS